MVQFVAIFGALFFERLAYAINTKNAILVSLVAWAGVVIYGYGFLHTTTDAWAMGAVIAIILGGSQALSRSLFSRMIPAGREASFFGIYEVSERGTSWLGPPKNKLKSNWCGRVRIAWLRRPSSVGTAWQWL